MKLYNRTIAIIISCLFSFQSTAQVLGSLNFDGIDNYAEITNSPMNEIGDGDFTFEAWIKGEESQQTAHPMILSNRTNEPSAGGVLFFFHGLWGGSQSKLLCVQIDEFNFKFVDNGAFNGSLLDNQCHHVAVTREGNTLTLYGDGIIIGTSTPPILGSISNNSSLWLGKDKASNNTFNGLISQCRIWNIARTQIEINQSKNLSLKGDEVGLLAYWEMNDINTQILKDKTGRFDGTIGNSDQIDDQDPSSSEVGCVRGITSTKIEHLDSFLEISPNPTSDFVTINYQGKEKIQIRLIDKTGRILLSQTDNSESTNLDLTGIPGGLYFINVNDEEKLYSQKIIKLD